MSIVWLHVVSVSAKLPHLVKWNCLLPQSPLITVLKIKAECAFKTVVNICQSTKCHIPELFNLNTHCIHPISPTISGTSTFHTTTELDIPYILLLFGQHLYNNYIQYEYIKLLIWYFSYRFLCLLNVVLINRNVTPAFGKDHMYTLLSLPLILMLTKYIHST